MRCISLSCSNVLMYAPSGRKCSYSPWFVFVAVLLSKMITIGLSYRVFFILYVHGHIHKSITPVWKNWGFVESTGTSKVWSCCYWLSQFFHVRMMIRKNLMNLIFIYDIQYIHVYVCVIDYGGYINNLLNKIYNIL